MLFLAFTFVLNAQTFSENFKSVFLQSIKGLESQKGVKAGTVWTCKTAFTDFETADIINDEGKGVLALELTKYFKEPADAKDWLAKWEDEIEKLLPEGDYKKSKTYDAAVFDYMKTIFEFNAPDLATVKKRPSITLGIYEYSGSYALKIYLYEPYFKNQYQPK